MVSKKRGLGDRAFSALLGGAVPEKESEDTAVEGQSVQKLAVDLIQRGRYQPRRNFDEDKLQELADSISAQGVVQPIVVRPVSGGQYEIIAGERRWRATQLAGLSEIPVVINPVDDQTAMAMGLIENVQRDDLNPLEEAQALHRLLTEFELTHQQIAEAIGKSRTTVTNLVRLLDLNSDVKELVDSRQIEMGHARALLALDGDQQSHVAAKVAKQGLSVRETEALVRKIKEGAPAAKGGKTAAEQDPDVKRLVQNLGDKLGATVKLQQSASGKGKLVISYNNLDELEGILDHIH
ncbi:MAG: ParB/RepB/Spo0J family partition protein [bacterium]